MTYYSKYNLLKYHVLKILDTKSGWVWWMDIYEALPHNPKPKPETFCVYMNNLWKKGKYKSILFKKDGKYIRKKRYTERRYVLKSYINGKVHYKISGPGKSIFKKMNRGLNLKLRKTMLI